MFPSLTDVLNRAIFFFSVWFAFAGVGLLTLKVNMVGSRLSKAGTKRLSLALFVIATIPLLAAGTTIANGLYLRVDPGLVAELEFTRIETEQGAAVSAPRVFADSEQIQEAFALLSQARPYLRNHESYRDGYVIRLKMRGEPDFSRRLIFAYRQINSRRGAIVVPSVSRTTGGAIVDAGEYTAPEFHAWLAKVVDPLFSGPPETGANP